MSLTNKIIIKDLKIYAYHGVLPEEQKIGQFFLLDLTITTNFEKATSSDSIKDALNYAQVIKFTEAVFTEKNFNLIESAADFLCNSLLNKFKDITAVNITLKKPNAPIDSNFSYVAVEINKTK